MKVAQACPTLCDPMDHRVHGILQARILEWVGKWVERLFPSPGDLPNPGIKPTSPTLQADSLPAELQGKPKNIGVGSLSLFQEILLTQELNRGLLHYRYILYQLSYQETRRPRFNTWVGTILGEGSGNPLWYPCLENSKDTGAWQATINSCLQFFSAFCL